MSCLEFVWVQKLIVFIMVVQNNMNYSKFWLFKIKNLYQSSLWWYFGYTSLSSCYLIHSDFVHTPTDLSRLDPDTNAMLIEVSKKNPPKKVQNQFKSGKISHWIIFAVKKGWATLEKYIISLFPHKRRCRIKVEQKNPDIKFFKISSNLPPSASKL